MKSYFCQLNRRKIHFLMAGKGAPIILFHPSPSSSKMLIPLIQELAAHYTVIAPDTPGYGQSAPLPQRPKSLKAYCKYFNRFFSKIGLQKFAIYGSATGAQMGIRYSLAYPNKVQHLYLDNAAHFSQEQRTAILTHYFPDISPKSDGSHLMTLWRMVHDLFVFFPWCFTKEKYRLASLIPPATVLHQVALDYLEAGSDYHLAYKAAFDHEQAEFVQQLIIPTTIFHWQASIVKPYIEQLMAHPIPDNVGEIIIPKDRQVRYTTMKKHILNSYSDSQNCMLKNRTFSSQNEETIKNNKLNLPQLTPDISGAYLMEAWHKLHMQQIDNQTYNFEPAFLQQQLINWMKQS